MKWLALILYFAGLVGCSSLSGSRLLTEEEKRERGLTGVTVNQRICSPQGSCEYVTCEPRKQGTELVCKASKSPEK